MSNSKLYIAQCSVCKTTFTYMSSSGRLPASGLVDTPICEIAWFNKLPESQWRPMLNNYKAELAFESQNKGVTMIYKVKCDIMLDEELDNLESIDNESQLATVARAKAAFERKALMNFNVVATDTGERPNGNFEYAFEAASLLSLYNYLCSEITDSEDALYHMVSQIVIQ